MACRDAGRVRQVKTSHAVCASPVSALSVGASRGVCGWAAVWALRSVCRPWTTLEEGLEPQATAPSVERGRIFDAWEHLHVGRGMSDPNAHSLAAAKRQEKVKNEISRASLIMMIETAVTNETSIKETADTSSWIRALLPDNVTLSDIAQKLEFVAAPRQGLPDLGCRTQRFNRADRAPP